MPSPPSATDPRWPTTAVSTRTNSGSAARTTNAAADSRSSSLVSSDGRGGPVAAAVVTRSTLAAAPVGSGFRRGVRDLVDEVRHRLDDAGRQVREAVDHRVLRDAGQHQD